MSSCAESARKDDTKGVKPALWSHLHEKDALQQLGLTGGFVLFGCLIRYYTQDTADLWLYAYIGDQQWYCTNKIPLTNKNYPQKYKFVPYIGSWTDEKEKGDFVTKYRSFLYLGENDRKIKGFNPLEKPEKFGWVLYDHG